ncbi:MAG: hypothetical protein HYR63_10880 [Proteobacteria bacterium]|nr:hypothetical protein [Pseudomonadota bacterium]MBI3498273.1 hypothetical protein [Pseudomonadota bacterium]
MESRSEQQLWCAVIHRAYEDAAGSIAAVGDPRSRRRAQDEARTWFHDNGRDFRWTCDAAGFDADSLRASVLRSIAGARQPVAEHEAAKT